MAEDDVEAEDGDVEAGIEAMDKITKPVEEKQAVEATQDTLKLENVAEILGKEPKVFIEKYNDDLDAWVDEANNLYKSRIIHTVHKLGEMDVFNDDDENDNFWARLDKVTKAFIELMETDRADYVAMGKALNNAIKAKKKAYSLRDKNQFYSKLMKDKENLYLAKQAIDFYYALGVVAQRDSVVQDNLKMAEVLSDLVQKSDALKEVVRQYVPKREAGLPEDKPD